MVLHGVDDNEHVSKISGDDASSVVPGVLRPHNVYLVVSQVAQLRQTNKRKKKDSLFSHCTEHNDKVERGGNDTIRKFHKPMVRLISVQMNPLNWLSRVLQ